MHFRAWWSYSVSPGAFGLWFLHCNKEYVLIVFPMWLALSKSVFQNIILFFSWKYFLQNITVHSERSCKVNCHSQTQAHILAGVCVIWSAVRVIVLFCKNITFLLKSIKNVSVSICLCTLQSLFAQVGVLWCFLSSREPEVWCLSGIFSNFFWFSHNVKLRSAALECQP